LWTFIALAALGLPSFAQEARNLEQAFHAPPQSARTRVWWWWLNGNVDKEAISRDLAEMKAKGIGGAQLIDAGGAPGEVPPGPPFASPAWRELFKHALAEAERNGIELSVNIQSGWNLGGPLVTPERACKYVTTASVRIDGGRTVQIDLPQPKTNGDHYRDVAVLALPARQAEQGVSLTWKASSTQPGHEAELAGDGDAGTFWVSRGAQPGQGPSAQKKEWLQVTLEAPATVRGVVVVPRPKYGPRECTLQVRQENGKFKPLANFKMESDQTGRADIEPVTGSEFRLSFSGAYDPRSPDKPRNVQVAEWALVGVNAAKTRRPIRFFEDKAARRELGFSVPRSEHLLDWQEADDPDARLEEVRDVTACAKDGKLRWEAPPGTWTIVRVGYTLAPRAHVSTSSPTWKGLCVDYLDPQALRWYWKQIVEPLIADAGPRAGTTWKYVHTDSWELGGVNWTPEFPREFKTRRGYDMTPWLPVLAGCVVESRSATTRFLTDLRRTIADCIADNHYGVMAQLAAQHGMGIHPESGGPHGAPVDGLQCMGRGSIAMMEFWARSPRHRVKDEDRFFVKQASSAANTYGLRIAAAEAFTTIGPHYHENPADNLKPSFDFALCEGLNRVVWHTFTCSPASMGIPGQEYFAGTHFNPQVTWWPMAQAFVSYLNRCQLMMQQGRLVADALVYHGDWTPSFVRMKREDPGQVLPGRDYDVCNQEVLVTRAACRDGRIVLPDGMSYAVLVLPDRPEISLPALRKVMELVEAGATVVGPRPQRATGLVGADGERELAQLAGRLWGRADGEKVFANPCGKGRVVCGKQARDVLAEMKIARDLEVVGADPAAKAPVDWIHRRDGECDIYFVANTSPKPLEIEVLFRVAGKQPELWDAVSGDVRDLPRFAQRDGRTAVPLRFEPYQSWFVVFRKAAGPPPAGKIAPNFATLRPLGEIAGPWDVSFDPRWGGPEQATFDKLLDWATHEDERIRYYSGRAVYRKKFDAPTAASGRVWLDLGAVRSLARVRLNDKDLGIVWCAPWRVDASDALQPKANKLEIEVISLWPNRLTRDANLPADKRLTRTNVEIPPKGALLPSGLLGPVSLLREQ